MDLFIRNGLVFLDGRLRAVDLLARQGRTAAFFEQGARDAPVDTDTLDVTGCWVLPGLVDTHVHFRQPGYEYKEDYGSGSRAAAAGGVTMVVDMPNTLPPPNTVTRFREHRRLAEAASVIDFNHWALPTIREEIAGIAAEGAVGFKFFMKEAHYPYDQDVSLTNNYDILETFREISSTGLPCLVHPHDQAIWEAKVAGAQADGRLDREAFREISYGEDGIMQTTSIAAVVLLAAASECPIRVLHIQGEGQLRIVSALKTAGYDLTAEMNPQAVFTVEALSNRDPGAIEANWAALADGTLDVIGSDHAPHSAEEEAVAAGSAFDSVIGSYPWVQYWSSLFLGQVKRDRLSLKRFVEVAATKPAQQIGVYPQKGTIAIGSDADYAVFDPQAKGVVGDSVPTYTRGAVDQLHGMELSVLPVATVVRGRIVYERGKVVVEGGYGSFVSPHPGRVQKDSSAYHVKDENGT